MEQAVSDTLEKLAEVLQWLGRIREALIVRYFVRFVILKKLETVDDLKKYVDSL